LRRLDLSGRGFFLPDFVKKITKSPPGGSAVDFELATYYPIFLYLLIVLLFAAGTLTAAHLIGPHRNTAVKLMPYESGMDPIGDAHHRFDVKFYLTAILFLVFDVELLFLYPWAVVAYREEPLLPGELARIVFWEVLIFLATLVVAYVYAWRKGVFSWR
jgi:NADH-quinone oxidoreductase subunit A